jgi:tetratricopeptide (TPR) repeat protein
MSALAAAKLRVAENKTAGAKALKFMGAFFGTTEVVPCYKTLLLLTMVLGIAQAQTPTNPAPAATANASAVPTSVPNTNATPVRTADRRKAAKLFLAASKLYEAAKFEEAMQQYHQAAKLDPDHGDYARAADVARSHAVTALIQAAAKDRVRGDAAAARAALAHGLELEPQNAQLNAHLHELGDDALRGLTRPMNEQRASTVGEAEELAPAAAAHSFHQRSDQRQLIQQVFKAYEISASIDDSVRATPTRLDLDNVGFEEAARILGMLTTSFYVPLDAHHVLVLRESPENRRQFQRQEMETVYLSGLTKEELIDVGNLAKNVFDAPQSITDPSAGTITLRAPERTLKAFNATMRELLDGKSQVLLEVRMIQLAHTSERNTGIHPPQTMTAVNVYTEEQSLLNANQSLVQQIIASGLASANDPLAILGILAASGQISSTLLTNGGALFGGGKTLSALSPGSATLNLSLNSSDSRQLDQIQLRLGDGEDATLRSGSRYPFQQSSYSSGIPNVPKIPGLTGAGTSGNLTSLLSSYSSSIPNIPMVEYRDLGLTLKATPKVMREGDVALKMEMKIDALSGGSIGGNPILNSRSYEGVITLKRGETVELVSEMDKTESRAVSGVPGISEIPGMNDLTGKDNQKNYSTLLIIITPHVVRGTQAAGHSPMMRVERGQATTRP